MLSAIVLDAPSAIEGGRSLLGRLRWLREQGMLAGFLVLGVVVSLGGLALAPWLAWRSRRWGSPRKEMLVFLVVLVFYHVLIGCFVGHQSERYRVPVIPLLAILLVAGTFSLWPEKTTIPPAVPSAGGA